MCTFQKQTKELKRWINIIRCMSVNVQAGELEQVEQEININLQGLGVSLVNNHVHKEIAYFGINRYYFRNFLSMLTVISSFIFSFVSLMGRW